MKNVFKVFGLIALAAVIGFSMIACDSGGGGGGGDGGNPIASHLTGTWATDVEEIKFSGSGFEVLVDNKAIMRGNYTAAARSVSANITMAVNQIHGDFFNENVGEDKLKILKSQWYNKNQVIAAFRAWVKEEYPTATDAEITAFIDEIPFNDLFPTKTGTINDDTMTVDGTTYTKAGG